MHDSVDRVKKDKVMTLTLRKQLLHISKLRPPYEKSPLPRRATEKKKTVKNRSTKSRTSGDQDWKKNFMMHSEHLTIALGNSKDALSRV